MGDRIAMRAGRRIGEVDVSATKKKNGDAAIGATAEIEDDSVLTRNVDEVYLRKAVGLREIEFGVEPY